ncbi:hypothetical protein AB0H43_01270 [Hamadaea sp. NPDC050747]|uniref:hypothetical protein n=1 Tax=Hamadaea sp. NPDC050747 TaxID=3155789 RepID=UPI0033E22DF6
MADEDFITRGGVAYVGIRDRWPFYLRGKYANWPLAELRVGDDEIMISSLFGKSVVTQANLVSISRFGRIPVFSDGFKFVLRDSREAVVFWAFWGPTVRGALQSRGWNVVG